MTSYVIKGVVAVLIGIGVALAIRGEAKMATPGLSCDRPGWFPTGEFGLKDHSVFRFDGWYYLASIYVPAEDRFAYARSRDLCQWEELAPILAERTPGAWDEALIWAPFVYEESGTYYMYYTGVTHAFAQSIMLATSTNPADPSAWQTHSVIFQPDHEGMIWDGFDAWSDNRDPTVVKVGGIYYLYYTGRDEAGGIVGIATASSPMGPWQDWGSILLTPGGIPESPTLAQYGTAYYLFYNHTGEGERYRIGPSPAGPWSEPYHFEPGWAHEIWHGKDGLPYTSYLTNYTVTISRLTWNAFYDPPRPFVGANVYHTVLPLVIH